MATIVLTGGGTAGHVTPHLALLPYINDCKLYYIGSPNGIERDIITKAKIEYLTTPCIKFNRSFSINNLMIPITLAKGVSVAKQHLTKIKPDVIFSKGGYVSLPTVIAGHKLNIPVISHESDLTVGLANKISQRYCKKILTSFEQTASQLKNGLYVGPPLRDDLFFTNKKQGLKHFNLDGKKPILLILGGSQGSQAINQCVRQSILELVKIYDVIHVCGKNKVDSTLKIKGYQQYEFLDKINLAYSIANVCVSRAGSNTLFELLALKIPTLLIPLPSDNSRGDQVLNAMYFYKKGMVNVLEQNNLSAYSLVLQINNTYNNKNNILANLTKNPVTNGTPKIANLLKLYLN